MEELLGEMRTEQALLQKEDLEEELLAVEKTLSKRRAELREAERILHQSREEMNEAEEKVGGDYDGVALLRVSDLISCRLIADHCAPEALRHDSQ